nr:response regulator [bacterium]
MKILIVEDNKDLAELIKEKTDEIGFESICEYSAGEAFNFLKMNSPDLIVLDYFLPDNNALEFLKKLKSENISTPPFIVSTGQGDERIAVEMMKFGARDYIVKDSHFFDILPEVIKRTAREIENENKRKQAESALEQSLERIKALLNANPDLMFVFDRNNRIIDYHSTSGENGLFVKPQYFIEKTIDSIFPKEIAELTVQKINNVLENGKLEYLNYELEFNGLKRSYEARFVLCGENEVLSIVRDITEQKTTEKELDKLQKQLLQAQKMESIGRLAGGVAHDFNNMLGVIINNVELAFFYVKPDDELHSILSEIKKAADKSANITKQLLAFARKQM